MQRFFSASRIFQIKYTLIQKFERKIFYLTYIILQFSSAFIFVIYNTDFLKQATTYVKFSQRFFSFIVARVKSKSDILRFRSQVCVPTPLYRRIPGMNDWCQTNCLRYPPNCPPTICQCP